MSTISANVTDVKCDGDPIPGLQAIDYKIMRNRQNIHAIGTDERMGVDYGPVFVVGNLRVRSTYPKLDEILVSGTADVKPFQLVVDFKSTALGTGAWAQDVKTLTFDECYIEDKAFSMDANGVGVSVYQFTSTRIREQ